jgi:glycolate oxidase iron-sulfur subunit
MDLGLDDDDLASCVSCGLCLPHCPTFRISGDETRSPRGRIEAMRAVQRRGAPVTPGLLEVIDSCVQCRGCETACPSDVPFGRLMESTRASLVRSGELEPWWRRAGHRVVGWPRLLRTGSRIIAAAQRAHVVPRWAPLPQLPLRQAPLVATGDDAWLFTGCVADAWDRDTHAAAIRLLSLVGIGVEPTGDAVPCCGALASHAGLADLAADLGETVVSRLDDDRPIIVDVAGCGAQLTELGRHVGPAGESVAGRTVDIHTVLAERADRLPPPPVGPERPVVAIHDPCHLRHAQRQHAAVHELLGRYVELVPLDDEGLCCGAGGAFAALHPDEAAQIAQRKVDAVRRSGATLVASANVGCTVHLARAGLTVTHPVRILDDLLRASDQAS